MSPVSGSGRFGTVVTAMVTPFGPDGSLDVDGAVKLAKWLVDHGTDGLVLAGTTGEGPVLSGSELSDLWNAVRQAVEVPILAGTGTNDTAHSVELTELAQRSGADGVLVVTPYYSRPSQAGLFSHFQAVAEASPLPVVLYDIPIRSGRKIESATMLRLAREIPNVVGVKDAAMDILGAARLIAEAPAGFEVYCGDDSLTLPSLAVGAVGVISVASHWVGNEIASMIAAFQKGDVEGARALNAQLLEAIAFQGSDEFPNPIPAKAICRALGLPAGQCRLPMGPSSPELDAAAADLVGRLGRSVDGPSQALRTQGPTGTRQGAGATGNTGSGSTVD